MEEGNLRKRIMEKAVALFSEKGYHGTSIREIAAAAECSLPMLYYYFKNKNDLYEEIVYVEFLKINEKLKSELPVHLHIKEIYTAYVLQRKRLSEYEKAVYKMALKAWMCIEGNAEIQKKLKEWEESRIEFTKNLLKKHWGDSEASDIFGSIFVRMLENMVDKIVLINEDIPDEQIRAEIFLIFDAASRMINNAG
ncbi:MAG: Transcriptional regulator, AcrR family [Firmicutes bacterium]|nr:Transcriptional regulator, AcrR family [Bacillota bacterium]MDI6705033.1 TetR/AcrR family transcriptional regulator [Bacillota bacterium]